MRTHTAESASPATNNNVRLLELAERRILDSIRFARSGAIHSQKKGYARDLAGDVLSRSRLAPVRHILALLRDAFERDATEAHLQAVTDQIRNEIHAWYVAKENASDFDTAHIEEEIAEGDADVCEARFRQEKSFPAYQRLEHAHRLHSLKVEAQLKAAKRMIS